MAKRAPSAADQELIESRAAWNDFLDGVHAACGELEDAQTHFYDPWFRGHIDSGYELIPQLFRGYPNPNEENQKNRIQEQEQDLYWEFASRARELHGVIDDDWDILFAMQHYGVPTRLLDWTENLLVAVYFALHRFSSQPGEPLALDSKHRPCVWILNPYELNALLPGVRDLYDPKNLGWDEDLAEYWSYSEMILDDEIDWKTPVAVYPRVRTDRMQAQRGWFTIHGTDFQALQEHKRYLHKIELKRKCFRAAFEALEHAGISLFTMFPELPTLAVHLKRQQERERSEFLANRR